MSTQSTCSLVEDLLIFIDHMSINDIRSTRVVSCTNNIIYIHTNFIIVLLIEFKYQPHYCATLVTVVSIEDEWGWFYNSCKRCNKRVDLKTGGFFCDKCQGVFRTVVPRFGSLFMVCI